VSLLLFYIYISILLMDIPSISDKCVIPLLGNIELVASDHLDAVDSQCIEGDSEIRLD
jgi:hypothetical protein